MISKNFTGKDPNRKNGNRIIYFDCCNGISGDMILGALLDSGLALASLQGLLGGLKLPGYSLQSEKVSRGGIAGSRFLVNLDDRVAVERRLSDILAIIGQADLPPPVFEKSAAVFNCLAEAEAKVHGITRDEVHFHEVGAVDAIVDIVGTCAAVFLLEADQIICSPLPVSRGEIESSHGRLPLPAPATLEILAGRRVPVEGSEAGYELVTPTGAALSATLADSFGPFPNFSIEAVGYGAGSIDPGYPNYLRVLLGCKEPEYNTCAEEMVLIETNIDDLNPEIYSYLMEKLLGSGALDVYYTPVQMKKNRPGVQLTVISPPDKIRTLQDLIFSETTTLGIRHSTARKIWRPRETKSVQTKWGPVKVKYVPAWDQEFPIHFSPEYEDCRAIAMQSGLPLKEVYRLVEYTFRKQYFSK